MPRWEDPSSLVLQIRSQYPNPGNYRAFSLIQSSTITLAHPSAKVWEILGNPGSTSMTMSRICGSSRPTPTPLNDKVTKPPRYAQKEKKKRKAYVRSRKCRSKSSMRAIVIPPARGVGRESVYGKASTITHSTRHVVRIWEWTILGWLVLI